MADFVQAQRGAKGLVMGPESEKGQCDVVGKLMGVGIDLKRDIRETLESL